MKRRELRPTVRYFASTHYRGFHDDTLYIAHEANGQNWHITQSGTRTPRRTGLNASLYYAEIGNWKEVILPDNVLHSARIITR